MDKYRRHRRVKMFLGRIDDLAKGVNKLKKLLDKVENNKRGVNGR